jgi:hypothetical protein
MMTVSVGVVSEAGFQDLGLSASWGWFVDGDGVEFVIGDSLEMGEMILSGNLVGDAANFIGSVMGCELGVDS